MKVKLLGLVVFLVMGGLGICPIFAQTVHQVNAGDGTLEAAVAAASDGDIIELVDAGGVYFQSSGSRIDIDKTLTIRAQEGLAMKPIVRNTDLSQSSARLFEIQAGGNLTLIGLDLDCRASDGGANHAKNAVRSQDVPDTTGTFHFKLFVEDCRLHHSTESLIKAHRYTIGDTVSFKNTVFDEANNEAVLFRESTSNLGPEILYAEFENCTFTRIGREAIYIEFSDPVVRINHCTFDSISWRENKRMVYPRNVNDVEIKNCIFTNQGGTQSQSIALYGNSSISYSDTFNVAAVATNGSSSIGAGMLGVDPQYTDPANDDYTLQPTSPVLGMADDGYAMGDLRWDPTYGFPIVIPVKAGDGTIEAALAMANDGDTLELVTSGGLYEKSSGDKIVIDKEVMIRARTGLAQKPIIRNTDISQGSARLFEIQAGGSLHLVGLDLDGRAVDGGAPHAKNFVRNENVAQADSFAAEYIRITDCYMHDAKEKGVMGHAYTRIDTISITNSIFYNCLHEAVYLRESDAQGGPDVRFFELENCTFVKVEREAVYSDHNDPVMRINHCTFDSVGAGGGDRILYLREAQDAQIKNSIFSNQGGYPDAIRIYGSSSISYCDTFNVGLIDLEPNATIGPGMLGADPLYNDPANFDYRLAAASPVRGQADDGRAMGDLRWEVLPSQYYLNIVTVGNGLVTLNPPGGVYDPGTMVTMTAVADPGWEFSQWTGNVFPPNANPVTITMNQNETVTATFVSTTPQVTLTVDTVGYGHVDLSPEPVNGTYDLGTLVTMTAVPQTDWQFAEWLGDTMSTENPLTVAVDSNMAVTARFESVFPQVTLTMIIVGQGNVSQDPEPILGTYSVNTMVTITANPALGWEFSGWSGDLVSTDNPDSILMDTDKTVTATFVETQYPGGVAEIDTTWDLRDAVELANNNSTVDTLVLITSGGVYTSTNTSDVVVTAPLTIKAEEGLAEKPIITNSDVEASNLDVFRVFDDFTLIGVELDGGHPRSHGMKYGIRLRHYSGGDSVKNGTNITLINCDFHDFYEGKNPLADGHAVRLDVELIAGVIKAENCTFYNFGYEAFRLSETEKYLTDRCLDSLIVRNCTFKNIDAEAVRYYSDLDPNTPDAPVILEHITIDSSATRVFYLKNSGGAIVRDIIISNSRTSGHGRDGDLMDAQGNTGVTSFVSDIDTFNVLAVPIKSADGQVDETTVWGIDPHYEDPLSFNYTLLPTSHLYGLGHDGEALGDLNWATNIPVHVALTINIVDSGSVVLDPPPVGLTYDPNTLVWLTAVPDTGFEFIEWTGDLTGSTNPDSIRMDGNKVVTAVFARITGVEDLELLPTEYSLGQNYPNPFNPSTTIQFALKDFGHAKLKIYDILGREVATLIDKEMQPGYYKVQFQDPNLATGVYFYRLESGDFVAIKKMLMVK